MAETPRDPDRLIARSGVRGDPDRDQHFLIDDRVLDRIAEYGAEILTNGGTVLEIGPGPGSLTDRLLRITDRVVAVELDARLASFLSAEFDAAIADGRLEVVHGDALEVDLPAFDAVVANLPYSAASEIIFRLLPAGKPLIVMVQREFAERIIAEPGTAAYGRLSVTTWWFARGSILEVVPPTAFDPAPPVESAVVRLTPRPPPAEVDQTVFQAVVRAIFTQRRKTLRNAIRNTTHISGIDDTDAVLDSLDDDLLRQRPDAISPEDYVQISEYVQRMSSV